MIPSMGGTTLGRMFRKFTARAKNGTAIVELGTWLGAGTYELASGLRDALKQIDIHTYDWFIARGNEVEKAAKFGVNLSDGQDTEPLVMEWLKEFDNVIIHKGEIGNQKWCGKKISIYVDDACKWRDNFLKALSIFSPYWIPGETIVIFMDYYFYLLRPNDKGLVFQHEFVEAHRECFQHVTSYKRGCTAVFRYLGGLMI